MNTGKSRWVPLAGALLAAVLVVSSCSDGQEQDEEGAGPATVEAPTPDPAQTEPDDDGPEDGTAEGGDEDPDGVDDSPGEDVDDAEAETEVDFGHDSGHDHFHGETGGDLDEVPDGDQINEAFEVAAGFWEAYQYQDYNHDEGVHQWIERVRPYVTERYYTEEAEPLYEVSGGVAWDEVFFNQQDTLVQVREVAFDETFAWSPDRIAVALDYGLATSTPEDPAHPRDAPAQRRVVIVERTEDGWRVDQVLAPGQSGAGAG